MYFEHDRKITEDFGDNSMPAWDEHVEAFGKAWTVQRLITVAVGLFGAHRVVMISQNLAHLIYKFYLGIWCKFILDFHVNNQYR